MDQQLRLYQRIGVEFLAARRAALLCDEMGLGKTVQVAVAMDRLRREGKIRRALVVVPAALRANWLRELAVWTSGRAVRLVQGDAEDRRTWYGMPVSVLIASYEQVRLDFFVAPPDERFDLLVLDEAHRLKDPLANTTIAVARIEAERIWALTGTPLENRALDLVTLIRLLGRPLSDASSAPVVHEALQGMFLRRRKQDVLADLPSVLDETVAVTMEGRQRAAYDELWNERRRLANAANALGLLTRLKQLCNHDPDSGESAKLEVLRDVLMAVEDEGGRLLVFSQYVETLCWLTPRLDGQVLLYHGRMDADERERALRAFRETAAPVTLLMSLRAGGVGLNLPEASHLVLYDRWWNPAIEDQAVHRAQRFGRNEPLVVQRFLTVDSVEERVERVITAKRQLFEEYVEGAAPLARVLAGELTTILDIPPGRWGDGDKEER